MALADYYAETRRAADAVKLLEGVATKQGAFAEARTRIAAIQYAEGHPAEAHKTIDEVLAREPDNGPALLVKARFLLRENQLDAALARATTAVRSDPESAAAQYMLGNIQASRHDTDAAVRAFQEALRLNPRAVAAQLQLARLQLATGAIQPAAASAEEAVSSAPDNPVARLMLVRTLLAKGDLPRAEAELNALAAAHPNAPAVHACMGSLRSLKHDARGARESYTTALRLDPGSFEALSGLVVLDAADKNWDAARARIAARLAQAPDDPQVLVLDARTQATSGDQAGAERTLRKVLEVAPDQLQAYGMLGRLYVAQGKLDLAKARFEDLSSRQPNSIAARTMVGLILQMQGKNAEAQRAYEQVLEIDPRAPVAANNLAWTYAEQGSNLDVALQLAQAAKAGLPDSAEVNDTLGWIYARKGLPGMAVGPLLEAIEASPRDPSYHYHLGMVYVKTGDRTKAKVSLETALRLDPKFVGAADAEAALATLR